MKTLEGGASACYITWGSEVISEAADITCVLVSSVCTIYVNVEMSGNIVTMTSACVVNEIFVLVEQWKKSLTDCRVHINRLTRCQKTLFIETLVTHAMISAASFTKADNKLRVITSSTRIITTIRDPPSKNTFNCPWVRIKHSSYSRIGILSRLSSSSSRNFY